MGTTTQELHLIAKVINTATRKDADGYVRIKAELLQQLIDALPKGDDYHNEIKQARGRTL